MINLTAERLMLRPFRETDGEELYEYLSDAETVKFEPHLPFDRDAAYGEAIRRAGDEHFIAVCLKSGKLIGNLYFGDAEFGAKEVGYVFNRSYWHNGYACEALNALLNYAFTTLETRRIIAMCDPQNPGSWKLLERVGMRREAHLLQNVCFFCDKDGEPIWKYTYQYALLRSEFLERKQ